MPHGKEIEKREAPGGPIPILFFSFLFLFLLHSLVSTTFYFLHDFHESFVYRRTPTHHHALFHAFYSFLALVDFHIRNSSSICYEHTLFLFFSFFRGAFVVVDHSLCLSLYAKYLPTIFRTFELCPLNFNGRLVHAPTRWQE